MFVVTRGGKVALNIEKTEMIKLVHNKVDKKYCIDFDDFDETKFYSIADYETHEAAEYAFQQMIIAIAKGDKVFFMPPDEEIENEISAESIREMMNKVPITAS